MADEIQKLDLNDATEKLKAKIQSAFVDIIPDEQWTAMIQGELEKFTTKTRVPQRYGDDLITPPAFETLAQGVLLEVAREKMKAKLNEADLLPDGQTMEGIIQEWLEANLDKMVSHFLGEVVANIGGALMAAAAGSVGEIIARTLVSGVGVPDPQNPGYDRKGNYMG